MSWWTSFRNAALTGAGLRHGNTAAKAIAGAVRPTFKQVAVTSKVGRLTHSKTNTTATGGRAQDGGALLNFGDPVILGGIGLAIYLVFMRG